MREGFLMKIYFTNNWVIICSLMCVLLGTSMHSMSSPIPMEIYGGTMRWNDTFGYGGFLQTKFDGSNIFGISNIVLGFGGGGFLTQNSLLSYTFIPLLISLGYQWRPFNFPFVMEPIFMIGSFIGHRSDEYGNSDTKVGFSLVPACCVRYDISTQFSLNLLGGYTYSHSSAYTTRTVHLYAGVGYWFEL